MDNIVDAIIRDPGKPKPIYRQIVEHLKKRIISSDIKPGQSLPNMSDMVKQWDVGYPTVKSAMQLLEKEGLIRCEAGRGKGPVVLETKKTATECSIIFPRWIANKQFVEIAKGIQDYSKNLNVKVIIIDVFQDAERYLDLLLHPPQDAKGLILYPWDTPDYHRAVNDAINSGLKVVLVDRVMPDLKASSVAADHFTGAYEATKHLLDTHHCPVYYFGHVNCPSSACDRYKGWLEAMHEHNYDLNRSQSYVWELNVPEAEAIVNTRDLARLNLDKQKAKALDLFKTRQETTYSVFCLNDDAAKSIYWAADEMGLKVGKDVFVVGFGDVRFCELLDVPLTSVFQSDRKVGYEATRLLYDQIKGKQPHPMHLVLPVELKIRTSSTGKPE